ncbi:MAG TPA: hypothetical protein VJ652_12945 [Noviherbaspirillum sp.]|nr:hypothetical protein [Noviherbaspirillum sp.]
MHFRLVFVISISAVIALAGCTAIGYNIDKQLSVEMPERSSRVYVDGNGEGRHIVHDTHKERTDPGFTSAGAEIDKEIFKALVTRRQANDMALRDEPGCPDGQIKVCSISTGCACAEKRKNSSH